LRDGVECSNSSYVPTEVVRPPGVRQQVAHVAHQRHGVGVAPVLLGADQLLDPALDDKYGIVGVLALTDVGESQPDAVGNASTTSCHAASLSPSHINTSTRWDAPTGSLCVPAMAAGDTSMRAAWLKVAVQTSSSV